MIPTHVHHEDDPFTWSRILVRGPQSETFLQGQLSQDVAHVQGAYVPSLLLSPTSDVLSTCWIGALDDGFELLVAREVADVALTRLKQFHLRVDCTLSVEEVASGPFNSVAEQVRRGEPGPHEFLGLVPQVYGRSFVERTVSFTKGCFTGQELVGRLDARGSSVPWRYVRASGPSLDVIEAALVAKGPEGPKGVSTAVHYDGGIHVLGFIHRSAIDAIDDASLSVEVIP
jgi:folate-binding Fe-S cluster repair protein YgfZ